MQKPAGKGEKCPTCEGKGLIFIRQAGAPLIKQVCALCKGTGRKGYWTK